MSFDPNDPKWTAYIVGELDENERAAVESELQSSPALRQWVDELGALADCVKQAVASEPAPRLSFEQRRELLAAATITRDAAIRANGAGMDHAEPRRRGEELAGAASANGATVASAATAMATMTPTIAPTTQLAPTKQLAAWQVQPWGKLAFAFAAGLLIAAFCLPALQSNQRRLQLASAPVVATDRYRSAGEDALDDASSVTEGEARLAKQLTALGSATGATPLGDGQGQAQPRGNATEHLAHAETSTAPVGDDDPVVYPDALSWQELSLRRKQYTETDMRRPDGAPQSTPATAAAAPPDPNAPILTARGAWGNVWGNANSSGAPGSPRGKRDVAITVNKDVGEQAEGRVNYNSIPKPIYETKTKDYDYTIAKPTYGGKSLGEQAPAQPAGAAPSSSSAGSVQLLDRRAAPAEPVDRFNSLIAEEAKVALLPHSLVEDSGGTNAEAYEPITDNPFQRVIDNALTTFSVDVDTASYSNVRRFLLQNRQLPPPSAVRIEELLNYFPYQYGPPKDDNPFAVHTEVAACPWNGEHRLLRIGIKGREVAADRRPATNLVFLLDVSGSMNEPRKLPLVKEAMRLLIQQLGENDRVAVVVYAGASGLVLPSTTGDQQGVILASLDSLQAGGSTNGGMGIQLAYDIAAGNFIKGGANRVILATDGDFNVGVTDRGELVKLIEEKAKTGVFLTALGFGMGNLKDNTLEQLADKGNGAYAYIDDLREARKVFVEQMSGTLVTIAKDVKLQLEFNPGQVAEYRLIGYENRALKNEDFNDDKKDAGDIGAGHTVTALYELIPLVKAAGDKAADAKAADVNSAEYKTAPKQSEIAPPKIDPLKYTQPATLTPAAKSGELLTLKLRYKQPDGSESRLIEHAVKDDGQSYAKASVDFKFASAVALFGMLLRDSPYHGNASFDAALELAQEGQGSDQGGYRAEFLELLRAAKQLKGR